MLFQRTDYLGDFGCFLPDGDIDTGEVAALLVDDGVQGDGRLARRAVSDYQFALAPPDGNHAIDGFNAGLHRRVDRFSQHHVGRDPLDGAAFGRLNRSSPVQRLSQRVDHPPDKLPSNRHFGNASGGADFVTFFDFGVVAKNQCGDVVLFQVYRHTDNIIGELEKLVVFGRR